MNELLRKRLERHLENLPDEQGYLLLDFVEFLEVRYGSGSRLYSVPAPTITKASSWLNRITSVRNSTVMPVRKTMVQFLESPLPQ